jgi:hypothetical protein
MNTDMAGINLNFLRVFLKMSMTIRAHYMTLSSIEELLIYEVELNIQSEGTVVTEIVFSAYPMDDGRIVINIDDYPGTVFREFADDLVDGTASMDFPIMDYDPNTRSVTVKGLMIPRGSGPIERDERTLFCGKRLIRIRDPSNFARIFYRLDEFMRTCFHNEIESPAIGRSRVPPRNGEVVLELSFDELYNVSRESYRISNEPKNPPRVFE